MTSLHRLCPFNNFDQSQSSIVKWSIRDPGAIAGAMAASACTLNLLCVADNLPKPELSSSPSTHTSLRFSFRFVSFRFVSFRFVFSFLSFSLIDYYTVESGRRPP